MKPVYIFAGVACVSVLFICVAICGALLLPAINASREAARRMACSNNMKLVGLGMQNYQMSFKQLPMGSGGTGITANESEGNSYRLSGMASMLSFIEQYNTWEQIANPYPPSNPEYPPMGPVPWTDANDYPPFATTIPIYLCPSDPTVDSIGTNYVFCYGDGVEYVGMSARQIDQLLLTTGEVTPETAPDANAEPSQKADNYARASHRGMFASNRLTRFRDVLDGLSNTIAMSEVARSIEGRSTKSFVAKDINGLVASPANCPGSALDPQSPGVFPSSTSLFPNSRGYRWADGSIQSTGFTTVLPPNSTSCSTPRHEFEGVYSATSHHIGGVHVLMGDAAVVFMSETIDHGDTNAASVTLNGTGIAAPGSVSPYGLWGALGTKANKETIE